MVTRKTPGRLRVVAFVFTLTMSLLGLGVLGVALFTLGHPS